MTNPILKLMPELLIMKEIFHPGDHHAHEHGETPETCPICNPMVESIANDAFERAAKIVDGYNENSDWKDWPWTQCAADIRKLKT